MRLELLRQLTDQQVGPISKHLVPGFLVLDLGIDVVLAVLQVVVLRFFNKTLLSFFHDGLLLLFAFFLVALTFILLFLQLILGPLRVSVVPLTLVVKESQLLLSVRDNVAS